ncbi:MAG: tetratricopeptide repeat protein [Sandarakinorhabdus sp.]|nr:tetratricopeptide repeat protein [Sandarakinorhabdus sp.]
MLRTARPALSRLMAVALLAGVSAMPAAAAVSPAVGKALNQAAAAAKAGNTSAAISAVKAAQAAASTAEEKTKSAQMAGYVYTRAGRYSDAANALAGAGASPRQLAPLYYQAGQYDRAIAEARKAGGEDMQILIAQAQTRLGHPGEAVKAYEALIKANGPKPIFLENLAGAQYKSGDKAGYLATTEKLIRVDSSPARWKTLLNAMRQNQMRPEAKLALFHLMSATNTLETPADYQEFAKLALVSNQAGTAQAALSRGGAATGDAMAQKLAQAAQGMSAKAPAEAPKLAANPATALRGGNAFLGIGQYPQAIAAFDKAIAANGRDVDQARLFKGIAALKAGNVPLGKASFAAVSDKNGLKDIANLWGLYAATRGAIAAPAAAKAA